MPQKRRSPKSPRNPWAVVLRPARRRRGSVRRTEQMSARKAAYLAYIRSPAWRAHRAAWWEHYDSMYPVRTCYCCGRAQSELTKSLELHHRTYERLGNERWNDLVPACAGPGGCHPWISRRWRNRAKLGLTMTLWELTEARRTMMRGDTIRR